MGEFAKRFMSSKYFWCCFFVGIAIIFSLATHGVIMLAGTEIGDFAANSLLIQDAKHFNLSVGNYSRVGFNHPGPAILYVLTFGEVLFYDWLHWVPSPMAGQLLAIALYNAFWITLFAKLLHSYTRSMISTIAVLSVFLAISSSVAGHAFFTGAWFPHLYYGPFAVLLLALAYFAEGRTNALFSLALSTGFLINGHVSFIAISGIMLIFALAYNYFASQQNLQQRVLSSSFLSSNKTQLLLAFGLLLVFFVPLLLQTIRHYPGPIVDYSNYDKQHVRNHLSTALIFIGNYWGGVLWMVLAAVLGVATYCMGIKSKFAFRVRSILVILLAATAALLFYAVYGVDDLSFAYIGYFYYAVPALLASVFLLLLVNYFTSSIGRSLFCILLILVGFPLTYKNSSQLPQYVLNYNDTQMQTAYTALNKLKDNGRLVLDLDGAGAWVKIVGIASYAKRHKNDLFCINKNWHILFTEKLQCSREEIRRNKRFFVTELSKLPSNATPDLTLDGLGFLTINVFTLQDHNYYSVNEVLPLLEEGWSAIADNYAWSVGTIAKIAIKLPLNFSGHLMLDLGSYLPKVSTHQDVQFYIDGKFVKAVQFSVNNKRTIIKLPITTHAHHRIELQLNIKSPIAPSAVSSSADTRPLGVALYGLEIQRENGITS
ncbi:MAG: hypothetical protein QM652_11080 [Legionella sp.]|uniref:hypothetical protein n=1 Tax=Legionella sp. TaxID=459 RepID=UPI0039E5079F